jgi:uncharacterized membrane protein YuzA (DUF378 family)
MKALKAIALVLLVIGGLNWLLVGLFGWDVGMIFGGQEALISRIIYILVGLSAILVIVTPCNCCGGKVEALKTAPQAPTM